VSNDSPTARAAANPAGFGSISRRQLSKPLVAAVNGVALGGGSEMVVNADLVVAGQSARFGFPEVKRGVIAGQGTGGRLVEMPGGRRG
jgi:enoyl-CoA hydratase/carnithine racemase